MKTNESFVNEVFNSVNNEYTFLENYKGTQIKILVRHNLCGHEYLVTPNKFLSLKRRCPKCAGTMKKTTDSFKKEIETITGNEYTLVSDYVNNKTKVKIKHSKCGHEYLVTPMDFLSGDRCPECSKLKRSISKRKSPTDFAIQFQSITEDEYSQLSEYTGYKNKILIKHNLCGHEYLVRPNEFLNGNRCPSCSLKNNTSNAVRQIIEFLENNTINFEREVKFEECVYKSYLPFDFYLEEFKILIEYDGEQHFRGWSGNQERLKIQKIRDKIKEDFCKKFELTLIRIPYFECLDTELNKLLELVQRLSKPH